MHQYLNLAKKNVKNKFTGLYFPNSKVCTNSLYQLIVVFLCTDLFPNKQSELNDFRAYLIDGSDPMTPLKAWQMQDLSLQCAARALSEKTPEEAFNTLVELSQNFPSRAR